MVDIKCSFPKSKHKKQVKKSSTENQDDENLLGRPIGAFCAGFREAKKAYEDGTDEVRQLLMQECSLIYECKICRNMFRNLSNFICHKRKYCNRRTVDEAHFFPNRGRNKFTIQSIERSNIFPIKSRSTDSSPIQNASSRDICGVIERLKRVEVSNGIKCRKTPLIDNVNGPCSSEPDGPDLISESQCVAATKQTLKTNENVDSIKTALDEDHNLTEHKNTLIVPNGKLNNTVSAPFTSSTVSKEKEAEKNNANVSSFLLPAIFCEICKIQFSTEKSLKMHIGKDHTPSPTYVFQCPTCTMTFLQPAAVIRHLANEHRKPLRRIRKMRDTILKKRIQVGDVQIKGVDREVKTFQLNNTKDKYSCSSVNQSNENCISSCSYCSKTVYTSAALGPHLINCLARNGPLNHEDLPKRVNNINQQKFEAENQNQNERLFNEEVTTTVKQESAHGVHNSTNMNSPNTINKLFENLENQTFGNGLHTVCLENIVVTADLNENSHKGNEETEESEHKSDRTESDEKNVNGHDTLARHKSNKGANPKRFRVISASSKQLTCRCKICNKQFNALSNLRRHISMFHYRSKRFGCNLCDYRAFRRYDIVNHLTFVHKMTGERESMAIEYVTVHEIKYSKNDVEGDIVLINEEAIVGDSKRNKHQHNSEELKLLSTETTLSPLEQLRNGNKTEVVKSNKGSRLVHKRESIDLKVKSQVKVARKKLKKTLETQVEGKMRPIRNRIKTVNNDFVYDLLTVKEEPKQATRLAFKRSNTILSDQNDLQKVRLATPPSVKIMPYRLRTEPLTPADKSFIKGAAENVFRNVIHDGLAAPSTLPELPTERPQMRSRLISASRSDLNTIPVIESSELEAAGLKSTFFDDSFLEKFAKKSNPSFKMKPLLGMQHSPLNSILQKFDASQQNNVKFTENANRISPNFSICLLESLTLPSLKDKDVTPNSKQMLKPSSPPAAPRKRITLMDRLAENRAKRRDTLLIHTASEN